MRIYDLPARTVMEVVTAVAANPGRTHSVVGGFAGYGETTTRRALTISTTLGLVEQRNGGYVCSAEAVTRSMPDESAILVFREALQSYRPFVALCEGIALGETPHEAARRARIMVDASEADEKKFEILLRWGRECGVLEARPDGTLSVRGDLGVAPTASALLPDLAKLDSAISAQVFSVKVLGRDAHGYLDAVDQSLLADALLKSELEPKTAIEAAGQALEDFLRHVAKDRSLGGDAKKLSGAGQLANLLQSRGIIHAHQQKLVEAPATVRNAKAHKKDKSSLRPWELTPEAAIASVVNALVAIRSIYEFVFNGRQRI
jgi:hypothetical protein